jgi:hypothetical protein
VLRFESYINYFGTNVEFHCLIEICIFLYNFHLCIESYENIKIYFINTLCYWVDKVSIFLFTLSYNICLKSYRFHMISYENKMCVCIYINMIYNFVIYMFFLHEVILVTIIDTSSIFVFVDLNVVSIVLALRWLQMGKKELQSCRFHCDVQFPCLHLF